MKEKKKVKPARKVPDASIDDNEALEIEVSYGDKVLLSCNLTHSILCFTLITGSYTLL